MRFESLDDVHVIARPDSHGGLSNMAGGLSNMTRGNSMGAMKRTSSSSIKLVDFTQGTAE